MINILLIMKTPRSDKDDRTIKNFTNNNNKY